MSSKKDKLIEEAQKMALRGQLDKAIKAYRQVVAMDATAINQRQRLAELLLKAGSVDEARVEFESIGKYYAGNGFYLKAIAVYKKLQMLFKDDIGIVLNLAELNEKHGLGANAITEYRQAYEYYKNRADDNEALRILEKMHNVDRQNIGIRLMLAEAYYKEKQLDQSYSAYSSLATLLYERGDNAACVKLTERIRQHFPDKPDFMLEVLQQQLNSGNAARAINGLQALLQKNPRDKRVWELLIEAFGLLGEQNRIKAAFQHYLRFFPKEIAAQKGCVECLIAEHDGTAAKSMLEQYELNFYENSAYEELILLYKALDQLIPLNVDILKSLEKAYSASGDTENAFAITAKIASLETLSSKPPAEPAEQEEIESVFPLLPDDETQSAEESQETCQEAAIEAIETTIADEHLTSADEEELEIEIEIEEDEDFTDIGIADVPVETASTSWLDSVDSIFDAITVAPRSVKFGNEVDVSDAQSHYDLGLAFKEMGLMDEAISELRQAAADPARKIACLVLQGACLRDKGDVFTAESLLRSLLNPGLCQEDACSVKYELALTCEIAGKADEAAALLAEIDTINPSFRDVHLRLGASKNHADFSFSDDEIDSFELK